MSIEVIQDTHSIVHADGEIDLSNIAEFVKALDGAAAKSPKGFIIDLSDTTYIDSAGVQAIFGAYVRIKEAGGHLAIVMGNIRIKIVLDVVHLERLPGVCVCEDLDCARQELSH